MSGRGSIQNRNSVRVADVATESVTWSPVSATDRPVIHSVGNSGRDSEVMRVVLKLKYQHQRRVFVKVILDTSETLLHLVFKERKNEPKHLALL